MSQRTWAALPGPDNCAVATSINSKGDIVGQSENGRVDPLTGIDKPALFSGRMARFEVWERSGGNHSIVSNINDHGQVAGFALNTIPDPFSLYDLLMGSSNGTQTRAFLWQNGHKRDLGTLGGPMPLLDL